MEENIIMDNSLEKLKEKISQSSTAPSLPTFNSSTLALFHMSGTAVLVEKYDVSYPNLCCLPLKL